MLLSNKVVGFRDTSKSAGGKAIKYIMMVSFCWATMHLRRPNRLSSRRNDVQHNSHNKQCFRFMTTIAHTRPRQYNRKHWASVPVNPYSLQFLWHRLINKKVFKIITNIWNYDGLRYIHCCVLGMAVQLPQSSKICCRISDSTSKHHFNSYMHVNYQALSLEKPPSHQFQAGSGGIYCILMKSFRSVRIQLPSWSSYKLLY